MNLGQNIVLAADHTATSNIYIQTLGFTQVPLKLELWRWFSVNILKEENQLWL